MTPEKQLLDILYKKLQKSYGKKSVVRTTERNAFCNARYNAAKFPADGNDPVAHIAATFMVLL